MSRPQNERLYSLDLFRGITMLLLLAEGTHLYYFLNVAVPENSIFHVFTIQLYHADWHGMRFWDLIQPYFTYIIGIAMAFSLRNRWEKGSSWFETFSHITVRCIILFFLGIVLQSGYREELVWELWNILTQLSISIFITFLVFKFPYGSQLLISYCLLLLTEILYRYIAIDGFDQPFVKGHNFGTWVDLILMGKTHPHGWVAFNCIPTTAHMIWGALTGKVLMTSHTSIQKLRILGLATLTGLVIGYGLDWAGISPVNKHIGSSSFIIASGGWCLLSFISMYWLVDIKGYKRYVAFFSIVGMNPIFIYVFSRTIGRGFLNEFIPIFTNGIMGWFGPSEGIINFTSYLTVLGIEWYICYWLYKRKIFIKI